MGTERAGSQRRGIGVVEIAQSLGVSTATVSRALNGSDKVRPELADRIREFADAHGYVANRHARALSATTSRAFIGFVIPYVDTPAFSTVAAECGRRLARDGTQLILTITENDPERELDQVKELRGIRTAGIVISPTPGILDETKELLGSVPVVEFHRRSGLAIPGVFMDDRKAMADAFGRLTELGHRRIGYIGTTQDLSNGIARQDGIRDGMRLAGLDATDVPTQLVAPVESAGFEAATRLLEMPDRPTALIVGGGTLSLGVADAVRQSGIEVPRDLSLIVYGDPRWFALHKPPLATISAPYDQLADHAVGLLHDALDGTSADGGAAVRMITPILRPNGSLGPPHQHTP
ncbi:LacI family transcriptional regulator [Tamaricihabitans halophyticus]|uniref:LacI family transcriptional regulator n=1 Tax=Tamaricihabitans halophyticus TaxID=1262583 RepID=A0A4R2Q4N4_9PSEU|nr:LacI family DNA-binding transcriptional regulator [Tamaricihabitans halophyticus]TCP43429.1 LacI family transcriptional regulator [Tamaricihabitans halophyticus]